MGYGRQREIGIRAWDCPSDQCRIDSFVLTDDAGSPKVGESQWSDQFIAVYGARDGDNRTRSRTMDDGDGNRPGFAYLDIHEIVFDMSDGTRFH